MSNSVKGLRVLGKYPRHVNSPSHSGHFDVGFSIIGLAVTVGTYTMFNVTDNNADIDELMFASFCVKVVAHGIEPTSV